MLQQVTIFTKHGCFGCDKTKQKFNEGGVDYKTINVEDHPEYQEILRDRNLLQMPVVTVYLEDMFDGETWSGLQPGKIASVVAQAALEASLV